MQLPLVKKCDKVRLIHHHTPPNPQAFQVAQMEPVAVNFNGGYHQVDNAADAHLSRSFALQLGRRYHNRPRPHRQAAKH